MPESDHPNARLIVGATYVALAELSDMPEDAKQFKEQGSRVYRELVEEDPGNVQALLGLAGMAEAQDERERILRQVVAIDPRYVRGLQWLANAISESGDRDDLLEAAELLERAYLTQTGLNKWHIAASAASRYERAGFPDRAKEFREIVREDFGLDRMLELLGTAPLDPAQVDAILEMICSNPAIATFGPASCLDGIQEVVDAVEDTTSTAAALQLAESAAVAMIDAAESDWRLTAQEPGWRSRFEMSLQGFLDSSLASAAIYSAYASVTTSRERRLGALQNAAALLPSDGQIALRLGLAYLDLKRWNEALLHLSRARDLLPDSQREAVDRYLELATRGLAEEAADQ